MLRVSQKPKPVVLCVLDGWGIAHDSPGNAITRAVPTNFNSLWFSYPHAFLVSSGQAVGLPEGRVGNSEVGHINLGAGRIVFQDLLRINTAIADGTFDTNKAFTSAIVHLTKYGSDIHLMGLIGLGSVHSEISHVYALLNLLKKKNIPQSRIKLHLFTDGRDSPPTSAKIYLGQFKSRLESASLGQIASISGRYFAMDRDNRWDRTEMAYLTLIGKDSNQAKDPLNVIDSSYAKGITDEFIEPVVIVDESGVPIGPIRENDAVIFFNYRPDRARQLTKAFVLESIDKLKTSSGLAIKNFKRGPKIKNLYFVTLTQYESNLPTSAVAFLPEEVTMPLARVFAERNSRQLHIAETEKYAHVTYFFNGGLEKPFAGEERILVNSPKVASYDQAVEMGALEITKKLIARMNTMAYDFIIVNYANADMVSHSGNIEATVRAVKCVDEQIGILVRTALEIGGGVIITSDHGNAEEMINLRSGEKDTEHNISNVPCILVFKDFQGTSIQLPQGLLADVAPTILSLLQIPKPTQMTGRSLL